MKQFAITCSLALLGFGAIAQKADSLALAGKRADYLGIFRQALAYDDLSTAAYALTGYLKDGGDAQYRDTLAVVYYRMGNMGGSYRLAKEVFEGNNKDITALTLLADISGRAGENKTSLEWYEKLCALQPDPYNFYQLATRQFIQERVGECRQSLNQVLKDSAKAKDIMVSMEIQPGTNESVPVVAAAYNMLGVLAFKEKNNAEAKRNYELALATYPKFVIAKQNLDGLKEKPAAATKPPAKAKG